MNGAVVLMATLSRIDARATRRFLICRHGETTWNAIERLQGTIDESVLTPAGEEQARLLGERLLAEEAGAIDAVWVSSLGRARQTHAIVSAAFASADSPHALPPARVTPELREIELGKWEGRMKQELSRGSEKAEWRAWKQRPADFKFAEGFYPLRELIKRAERCWNELLLPLPEADGAEPSGDRPTDRPHTTLVIAHGGLNRALLVAALGLPIDSFSDQHFLFANCAWAELEISPADGGPSGAERNVRWRWRHPGPATEWQSSQQEQGHIISAACVAEQEPSSF
jgi:probable phosphoglycerate mutase